MSSITDSINITPYESPDSKHYTTNGLRHDVK